MIIEMAKRFAAQGYYVFPTFGGKGKKIKPYGWALNQSDDEVRKAKSIPASTLAIDIDMWEEKIKKHYNSELNGFGVLGRGLVIFDLDVKNGKNGLIQFDSLKKTFNLPQCSLIVRSKSGGYHLYYKKPKKYINSHVKSLVNITVNSHKYEGVDIRGDGGFVQGPNNEGEWVEGNYTIIKGSLDDELTEVPESLIKSFLGSTSISDLDSMAESVSLHVEKPNDMLSILRRGELPPSVPDGQRNEAFFVFVTSLKSKGIDREIAKVMCMELAKRCENPETLSVSVNINDMLARVYETSVDNPYDIGFDLVKRGLYIITGLGSRPKYMLLEDNPYIRSKSPHDLVSMRELMIRYEQNILGPDGKTKRVNPMDVAIKRLPPNQSVDAIGFKPVDEPVFRMTEGGSTFLNTYNKPFIPEVNPESEAYENFKLLISRIFGKEGTDAYQLGLDFCAWMIQRPERKPSISIFLMSEKRGVGKSLFLGLLTHLLGVNKVGELQARVRNLTDLTKRFFNPTGCVLNVIDEVQFSVHKNMRQESADFWRVLKNLITSEMVEIEIKNGGSFNVLNTAALILAGNTGSRFPIEEYDRRLWIIDNDAPVMQEGTVDLLYAIVKGGHSNQFSRQQIEDGINSIRWNLKHHEIKNDLSTMRAPMTALKHEMYMASLTDEEEWFINYFADKTNLLAASSVISEACYMFILNNHPEIPEHWRNNAKHMFREAKRRGHLKPIRTESGNYRQFANMIDVAPNGEIIQTNRAGILYSTKNHDQFINIDKEQVVKSYKVNLISIKKWRVDSIKSATISQSELKDLKLVSDN